MLSCKKNDKEKEQKSNQQELFTKKIAQYEKNGKPIILKSSKNQLIIYKDSTSFWLDNLKEPAKKIISTEKPLKLMCYHIEWDSSGKPDIIVKPFFNFTQEFDANFWNGTKKEEYNDYVHPYTSSIFKFAYNDSSIYFTYKYNALDRGGSPETYTSHYLYYFTRPDELFSLGNNVIYNETNKSIRDTAISSPESLAEKLQLTSDKQFPYIINNGNFGIFQWEFTPDNQGHVKHKDNKIIYFHAQYNKKLIFNIDDFSSKEKALNVLQEINDTIQKAEEKELIEQINKEAINIDDISNCFKNEVKAEKEFLNKELIVRCSIDAIEKADGWLDTDGYKYKIRAYSTELFDEWISGYDIVGYTNDEGFANLSCPNDIIMKCVLTSGSCRRFTFKDCELMLFGK